jgi:hypothetical protein
MSEWDHEPADSTGPTASSSVQTGRTTMNAMYGFTLLNYLQARDFMPDDDSEQSFGCGKVRVAFDDTDIVVIACESERTRVERWNARFRNAPAAAVIAAIESALDGAGQ